MVILDFGVKMMYTQQTDVRIGILMVNLPRKVYSYINLGAPDQKLIFHDGGGGHLGFGPLEKNAGTFGMDQEANLFYKRSKEVQ